MSSPAAFESDHKAKALETEIRKLKLELLKQELDDKLLTLKAYLQHKKINQTTSTTTVSAKDSEDKSRYLGSVLFVKVAGNVQVWQLVLIVLIFWMLLVITIGYMRRFIIYKREKYKKELLLKIKRQEKFKNQNIQNLLPEKNLSQVNEERSELSIKQSAIKNPMLFSNPSFNDSVENSYVPFRQDFSLYTIEENQVINSNKSFNTIRNKQSTNLSVCAKLSKSDTNINGLIK